MNIQELIEQLSKIRDKDPEKDTKKGRITRGWMFDVTPNCLIAK